jgi:hypothetical protein
MAVETTPLTSPPDIGDALAAARMAHLRPPDALQSYTNRFRSVTRFANGREGSKDICASYIGTTRSLDQTRIGLEPVAAPSSNQQRCGVSGDAYEEVPYSPVVDAYDDRCGAFDSIQSESFRHSPTTAASDDLPMLIMSGDPCSAFFQLPSLVEEESYSTMWIHH